LFTGFLCVLLLMAGLGGIVLYTLDQISSEAAEINDNWLPKTENILNVKYLTEHFFNLQLQYAMTRDLSRQNILRGEADQTLADIQELFARYEQYGVGEEENKYFQSLKASWSNYQATYQALVEQEGNVSVNDVLRDAETMFQVMEGYLDNLVRISQEGANKATAKAALLQERGEQGTLISLVAALLVCLLLGFFLSRHIRKPLLQVAQAVKQVSEGDLGFAELRVKNRDEIGEVAERVNEMRRKLRHFSAQVYDSALHVAASAKQLNGHAENSLSASNDIAVSLGEISNGAKTAAASADESAKAMEEMASGVQRVALLTSMLAEQSAKADQEAKQGIGALQKATGQMGAVNTAMGQFTEKIRKLGESSKQIGQILEMIAQIASQTDLLALNAAVEAARAGEYGRGFAVVAAEVRKLAEQSNHFSEQIAALIRNVQDEVAEAIRHMQTMSGDVEKGASALRDAEAAFARITAAMGEVAGQVQEVSAIAEEMSAGVEQLAASSVETANAVRSSAEQTEKIAALTKLQVQASEEVSAATKSLQELSAELKRLSEWFRLEP